MPQTPYQSVGRRRLSLALIPLFFAALPVARAAAVPPSARSHSPAARKSHHELNASKESQDPGAPPLVVEAADGGYNVTGRGFTLRLGRSGEISGLSCGGQPLFDEAYLEVRDKTWHVKLSPRPEMVQSFAPHLERDEARFRYNAQISDAATAIQLGIGELVTIKAVGVIDVSLRLVPQAPFEAQRISWNTAFAADHFVDHAYSWSSAGGAVQTALFPRQHAPDPQMARNFDWMRLNDGGGPVDLRFTVTAAKAQPLPVEDVLEDLRWWNQPRFWVADAAPYPRQNGDPTRTMEVPAGVSRTLKVTMTLHPGLVETGAPSAGVERIEKK